jgi:hypothetical protein
MKLIVLGVIAIIAVGYTMFILFGQRSSPLFQGSQKIESAQADAIRTSKKTYKEKKDQKVDMEASPCLSEDMGNGYALDIAHNPRLSIDEQNQCNSYKSGTVKHFVEMTPDGSILRIE